MLIKEPYLRASELTRTLPWWEGELIVPTAFNANPEDSEQSPFLTLLSFFSPNPYFFGVHAFADLIFFFTVGHFGYLF